MNSPPNVVKELERCLGDHEYYCSQYLKIITDDERLIPFKFNSVQKKLHFIVENICKPPEERPQEWYDVLAPYNDMANLRAPHINIRANILKARREGASTYVESRVFRRFHLRSNVKALITAHSGDSVNTIFRMSKVFYKELPEWFKPLEKHNNGTTLELAKSYSLMQIQKANETDTSRSKGASVSHRSELAFWQNALDTMIALNQLTDDNAEGSEEYNESTPNGEGGIGAYWYDMWHDTKKGKNNRINIFFSWFDFDKYTRKFYNDMERKYFIDSIHSKKEVERYGEEELIMKTHNLTYEQMNWRRWYVANKCENKLNKFMQEYPEDDESCFLTTAQTFFNIALLNSMKKKCREPETGDLVWLNENRQSVVFVSSATGFIRVWRRPDNNPFLNRYAMGWDVSLGADDGDYTCGELLDRLNPLEKENVLEWHGLLRSDLVGEELLKISMWYGNNIWHCIEQNGEGDAMINYIRDKYAYLYMKTTFGKFGEEPTEVIGFNMNAKTKGIVVPALRLALESGTIITYNEPYIDECRTFIKGEVYKGTLEGQRMKALNKGKSGKKRRYDDRVLAMTLAEEMARQMSPVEADNTKEPKWARELRRQQKAGSTYMGA